MTMLFFSCIDPNGTYQEYNYGGPDLESCLDALTHLVNAGWQLNSIGMLDRDKSMITLPVNAFDGKLFKGPLLSLQQEWEQILCKV